jgi:hypothetical protein
MKLNIQSAALKLVAIGFSALLVVLALGGIQAIARVNLISRPDTEQSYPSGDLAEFPSADSLLELPGLRAPTDFPPTGNIWRNVPFPSEVRGTLGSGGSSARAPFPNPESTVALSDMPRQEVKLAHPSNYGDRYTKDIFGQPVYNKPLIVLHETVGSASSAINTFQANHPNEDDQVSYHSLIRRDGTIIYVVAPEKRAFGAGNSAFNGSNGLEAVKTHRLYPPSVNNFAYHISLETPSDGYNNASAHSGYTDAQYQSLAWLIAQTQVPEERIVTHRGVDRSGSRFDPRSFDGRKFFDLLRAYPRPEESRSS